MASLEDIERKQKSMQSLLVAEQQRAAFVGGKAAREPDR